MKHTLRSTLYAILMLNLLSCSVIRNSVKEKSKIKTEEAVNSNSQIHETITEKLDTFVKIKPEIITGELTVDSDTTVIESDAQKVTITKKQPGKYKVTGEVKSQSIPVKIDKTTIRDVNTQSQTQSKSEVITKNKEVKTESSFFKILEFKLTQFVLALMIAFAITYFFYKYKNKLIG